MISYLFNNNCKVDNAFLLNYFTDNFKLEQIENIIGSTVLANNDMLIDIDSKYISILLYDETINIKPIKEYLLEKNYERR